MSLDPADILHVLSNVAGDAADRTKGDVSKGLGYGALALSFVESLVRAGLDPTTTLPRLLSMAEQRQHLKDEALTSLEKRFRPK